MQKSKPTIKSLTDKLADLIQKKADLQEQQIKIEEALRLAHSEYLQIMDEIKNLT